MDDNSFVVNGFNTERQYPVFVFMHSDQLAHVFKREFNKLPLQQVYLVEKKASKPPISKLLWHIDICVGLPKGSLKIENCWVVCCELTDSERSEPSSSWFKLPRNNSSIRILGRIGIIVPATTTSSVWVLLIAYSLSWVNLNISRQIISGSIIHDGPRNSILLLWEMLPYCTLVCPNLNGFY